MDEELSAWLAAYLMRLRKILAEIRPYAEAGKGTPIELCERAIATVNELTPVAPEAVESALDALFRYVGLHLDAAEAADRTRDVLEETEAVIVEAEPDIAGWLRARADQAQATLRDLETHLGTSGPTR